MNPSASPFLTLDFQQILQLWYLHRVYLSAYCSTVCTIGNEEIKYAIKVIAIYNNKSVLNRACQPHVTLSRDMFALAVISICHSSSHFASLNFHFDRAIFRLFEPFELPYSCVSKNNWSYRLSTVAPYHFNFTLITPTSLQLQQAFVSHLISFRASICSCHSNWKWRITRGKKFVSTRSMRYVGPLVCHQRGRCTGWPTCRRTLNSSRDIDRCGK